MAKKDIKIISIKPARNSITTRLGTIQKFNRAARRNLDQGLRPYEGSQDQARHQRGNWRSRRMGKHT